MSSICMEGIAHGIPLIIIENMNKLNFRTVPNSISKSLYKYCNTVDDIHNAINYFDTLDEKTTKSNLLKSYKIKSDYFYPVTKYNIRKFLNIEE